MEKFATVTKFLLISLVFLCAGVMSVAAQTGVQTPAAPAGSAPVAQSAGTVWTNPNPGHPIVGYQLPGKEGEKPASGDFWRTTGYFGAWTLACDIVISKNKKVCRIGQDVELPGGRSAHVDIAMGSDGAAWTFFFTPPDADREAGLMVTVKGAQTPIPFDFCNAAHCRASIPFDGMFRTALLSQAGAMLSYKLKGLDVGGALVTVQLDAAARASASAKALTGVEFGKDGVKGKAASKK